MSLFVEEFGEECEVLAPHRGQHLCHPGGVLARVHLAECDAGRQPGLLVQIRYQPDYQVLSILRHESRGQQLVGKAGVLVVRIGLPFEREALLVEELDLTLDKSLQFGTVELAQVAVLHEAARRPAP